jgi:hypothetical protein
LTNDFFYCDRVTSRFHTAKTQNGPHPTVVAWNWSIATNRLVRPAAIGSTPQRG